MRMQTKIAVTLVGMISAITLVLSVLMYTQWFDSIQKQVALDAKDQAVIIAEQQIIKDAMAEENGYLTVNKAVEAIQLKTGIQYLYIVSRDGRYYAHPIPEKLNTYYKEGDTKKNPLAEEGGDYDALEGDAMVEAYMPIYTDGVKSGVVIIGIYNGRILQTIRGHAFRLLFVSVTVLILGIVMAYALSKNIKKAMYGLEPQAIALLLNQQETILEQIGEGLLATDQNSKVVMVNENAKKLLRLHRLAMGDLMRHMPFYKHFELRYYREKMPEIKGEWRMEGGKILSIHMIGLSALSNQSGFLFKIEDMSLVRARAEELTNMKQLTQALRAQNHEFMNKLHTVSGLIQLEAYDDALGYIESITKSRKEMVESLNKRIKVSVLSGLILAKYSKALERHIEVVLDEDAVVTELPAQVDEADVTSVLGNLIDNAIEAMQGESGKIVLDFYHDEVAFYMSVSDTGPGMPEAVMAHCFEKGLSTKGQDRGYGLFIVKEIVDVCGGDIEMRNEEGLVVQVKLPMR